MEYLTSDLEFKFAGSGLGPGEFTGYGAVFGNQDSHGDVIAPGAFTDTLAKRGAEGRGLPMHVMHGIIGDGLPVGTWKSVSEDGNGLRVHGKISGMNTQTGQLHYERLKDGAYGGLSIGYRTVKAEPLDGGGRRLKRVDLHEISLVDSPSNALAKIDEIKAARDAAALPKHPAVAPLAAYLKMHQEVFSGGDSPTREERERMLSHLVNAHILVTGKPWPGHPPTSFPIKRDQNVKAALAALKMVDAALDSARSRSWWS